MVFRDRAGCGPVATVDYPGIAEPMLVVRLPDGGSLGIEFTDQAPDEPHVQRDVTLTGGTGLVDYFHDIGGRRVGRVGLEPTTGGL